MLEASGVARGALYHHFPGKTALFDAVLEQVVAELAATASGEARAGEDTLENLRAGARSWMEMALDPAVQRIYLLDPQAVVGWARWRELDERYWLGGLRASFAKLAREGRVPAGQEQFLAHMLCAVLTEAALFIAYSEDQRSAGETAQASVDLLLDRAGRRRGRRPSPRAHRRALQPFEHARRPACGGRGGSRSRSRRRRGRRDSRRR